MFICHLAILIYIQNQFLKYNIQKMYVNVKEYSQWYHHQYNIKLLVYHHSESFSFFHLFLILYEQKFQIPTGIYQ